MKLPSGREFMIGAGLGALVLLVLVVIFPVGGRQGAEQKPDADGYIRDCVKKDFSSVPPSCASVEAVRSAYRVDPLVLLSDERGRMAHTARMVARGDLLAESDFRDCIKRGACAEIPLASDRDEKKQKLFWHLVNDGGLTPEICDLTELCRAMARAGLVDPQQNQ